MALTEAQWQSLVLMECEDDGRVVEQWDSLWERTESLDTSDPTGELRFRQLVVYGLGLMLAYAASDVAQSDGGGQGLQSQQHFEHLKMLLERAEKTLQTQLTGIQALSAGVAVMETTSLTPPLPGCLDPGSPGYLGDPRYWNGAPRIGGL